MHTEIKTYTLTDENKRKLHFHLQTIEQIGERMGGAVDSPHRHDYYTIIVVKNGSGKHIIDFKEYEITGHSVYFIYPGQVHQFIPDGEMSGWVLTFTTEFLIHNNIREQLISEVYLYNNFGESPPLSLHDHELNEFEKLIQQLNTYNLESAYGYEAKGSLLKLLLIHSQTVCSQSTSFELKNAGGGNPVFKEFKEIVDKFFTSKHKVSEYANLLSVSSDYLNKVVKKLSGQSAKVFIQNRILIEAKRNLLFTNLSSKELAFQLGFDEPAHFSNFFKKNIGLSAKEFREAAREIN